MNLAILMGFSNMLIACGGSNYDGKEAEQVVEEFYMYYIENYPNLLEIKEEVAAKYLTQDYSEDYLYYLGQSHPLDILSAGGMLYSDGQIFNGSFSSAEYIGDNKVKVLFVKPDGGTYDWTITVIKVGSEYRISKVEV